MTVGEVLKGYIGQIRDDGRLNIALRPIGSSRMVTVKQTVLDALEGSPSGAIPVGDTPAEFDAFIRREMQVWGKIAKQVGLKPN